MNYGLEVYEEDIGIEALLTERAEGPWTLFWDMHSGGRGKQYNANGGEIAKIFIELPEDAAIAYFTERFQDPYHVTCNCCGPDYSVSEDDTLAEITGFHRNCRIDPTTQRYVEEVREPFVYDSGNVYHYTFIPLGEYIARDDVLVIYREEMEQ